MSQPVSEMMTLLCAVVQYLTDGYELGLTPPIMDDGQWSLAGQPRGHHSRSASYGPIQASDPAGLASVASRWVDHRCLVGELGSASYACRTMATALSRRLLRGGVDTTGFWRPRLQHCPTAHYDHRAGKACPPLCWASLGASDKSAHNDYSCRWASCGPTRPSPTRVD